MSTTDTGAVSTSQTDAGTDVGATTGDAGQGAAIPAKGAEGTEADKLTALRKTLAKDLRARDEQIATLTAQIAKFGKTESPSDDETDVTVREKNRKLREKWESESVTPLKTELETLKSQIKTQRESGTLSLIESTASAAGAYNAKQVTKLLASEISYSADGAPIVVDEDGDQRFNADGTPMTPAQRVNSFLVENAHLVKGGVRTGANMQGAQPASPVGLIEQMNAAFKKGDMKTYHALHGQILASKRK